MACDPAMSQEIVIYSWWTLGTEAWHTIASQSWPEEYAEDCSVILAGYLPSVAAPALPRLGEQDSNEEGRVD